MGIGVRCDDGGVGRGAPACHRQSRCGKPLKVIVATA
jgi:hypothetical protein